MLCAVLAACGGGGDGASTAAVAGAAATATPASTPAPAGNAGGSTDRSAPVVSIVSPAATQAIGSARVLALSGVSSTAVSGTARDDVAVTALTWSSNRGASGILTPGASWNLASLALQPGGNTVTVVARDAAGNAGQDSVTIDLANVPGPANECAGWYGSGFTLLAGTGEARPAVSTSRPPKAQRFRDPVFGTCVVRVTDHASEAPVGFARNDYSRRQAFNADDTLMIVSAGDGYWHLYDVASLRWLQRLPALAGDAEPQWEPNDPARLAFVPTNGGLELSQLDVRSGVVTTLARFQGRLPWPAAAHVWTHSEGSPSVDGRYWCFMVDDAQFRSLGLVTWDRATDTITGTYSTNGNRPDHVSASPSGDYCVVSWAKPDGTVAFDRRFATRRQVNRNTEHSDLARDRNGDDVYVSIDYDFDPDGSIFMLNLRTGVRTNLLPTYLDGSATALHFSGKAFSRPGWVLVSSYARSGVQRWLHEKIYAVSLEANPQVRQLAHHHVQYSSYFTEPHASVNRDFTRIVFNSNWERSGEDVDTYMIELPAGALTR